MILKMNNTNFHQYRSSILIDNINHNKIIVSNEVYFG